jgi:hypothetical protein
MKRINPILLGILMLIGSAVYLRCQDVTFRATVDRNSVRIGEPVTLTVSVSGNAARIPKPELPEMTGFDIQSQGSSRNFSFVNGKMQTSVSYSYVLVPRRIGKFTIGACEITLGGKTLRTAPIEIEVVGSEKPGKKKPTPGGHSKEDIFIETSVDKDRVYVGEQITLTFRLYSAVRILGNPQYSPPAADDFWRENLGKEIMGTEVVNGREYQVNELNYALFPLTPGEKTIGEARIIAVIDKIIRDPFDFGFSTGRKEEVVSDAIAIHVLPLPDKPEGFSGGVGRFEIRAELDGDRAKQNEPLILITTVEGDGNIREIEAPRFEIPGFRIYDSGSSVNIAESEGKLLGTKTFKTILIPAKSGEYKIPERQFIFFDPVKRVYVTKRMETLPFSVAPGEETEASEKIFSPFAVEKIGEDIHFIKLGSVVPDQKGMGKVTYFVLLNGMLLCAFLFISVSIKLRERARAHEDTIRKRAALGCAMKALEKATRQARKGNIPEAYEMLHKALFQFFADKYNLSIWGITEVEIMRIVRSRGGDDRRAEELGDILQACNRARYSTEKPDMKAFKKDLEKTRRALRAI